MLFQPESVIETRRKLYEQMQAGALTAEQLFQQALAMDASDPIALIALAQLRAQAGDLATAEQYCWRAMDADPTRYGPYFTLHNVLERRGAEQPLLNGILELGTRKAARDEDAVKDLEEHAQSNPKTKNVPAREMLEATADSFLEGMDEEPAEVAARLEPYRLIDELLQTAAEGMDPELVDAIVDAGARCVPQLVGVLRAMAFDTLPENDFPAAVASVALIGEIGDLAALPEVLECVLLGDPGMLDACSWAVARIAARQPDETFEALQKLAAASDVKQRSAIAIIQDSLPEWPGKLGLLRSLLDGLEAFPKTDRHELFMAVAGGLLLTQGARGPGETQSLLNRYAPLLPRHTKADVRNLQESVADFARMPKIVQAPGQTIYDFCEGAGEDEDDQEDDEDSQPRPSERGFIPAPIARAPQPGRNDPCWCGSGKKYKKCHLEADENARQAPVPAPPPSGPDQERKGIEDSLRQRLLDFVEEAIPKRDFKAVIDAFVGEHPLDDDDRQTQTVDFIDWLIHDCVVPRIGQPIIPEFLKRHPGGLTARQRRMLEDWSRSRYSLYEVQEVRPGSGVVFKDLLAGGETFVHDVNSSKAAARWDCFLGRVEETEGRMELNGVLRLIPRHAVGPLTKWAQVARERSGLDWDHFLRANSHKLRQHAIKLVEQAADALQAVSAEGDPIVFSRAVYDVVDEDALRQSLDRAEELEPEDPGEYAWLEPEEAENAGRRSLGHLRIAEGRLTLECMTKQRLARGKQMLRRMAGSALHHKADELTGFQSAMRAARTSPPRPPAKRLPPEAEREVVQKVMAEHYRTWPDISVPALDGKTPRQAALQPEGRARLVELLKTFENAEERNRRDGRPWYDVTQLKAELGIEY